MLRPGELIFAVVLTLLAWAFSSIKSPASAHDWYPMECCHSLEVRGDCGIAEIVEVLPEGRKVRQVATGMVIMVPEIDPNTGKPNKRIRVNTHDNLYHVCVSDDPETGLTLHCFFEPQGSYHHGRRQLQNPHPSRH